MKDQATNLRILAGEQQLRMSGFGRTWQKVIMVLSGKGGVGKSFFSLHLARALAGPDNRILLVDGNMQSPNLHVLTNVDPAYPISYWMDEAQPMDERAVTPLCENLDLLANSAPAQNFRYNISDSANTFLELLEPLAADYSYIVLDSQTGLNQWNLSLLQQADLGLLVSITDPTSVIDSYTFIKASLPYLIDPDFRLVVNQVIGDKSGPETHQNLNLALQHFLGFEIDLLGVIPFDMEVKRSGMEQKPLWEFSRQAEAWAAVKRIATAIHSPKKEFKTRNHRAYQEVNV